jgi:adenylate cyclase
MFVDMRGSTRIAEELLPFDTVFIINRFLSAASQAVLESGGQPNQSIGDGMLALFGLATTPQMASRQAIVAAARIAAHVDELNQFLGTDIPEPLRLGIDIHGGGRTEPMAVYTVEKAGILASVAQDFAVAAV